MYGFGHGSCSTSFSGVQNDSRSSLIYSSPKSARCMILDSTAARPPDSFYLEKTIRSTAPERGIYLTPSVTWQGETRCQGPNGLRVVEFANLTRAVQAPDGDWPMNAREPHSVAVQTRIFETTGHRHALFPVGRAVVCLFCL